MNLLGGKNNSGKTALLEAIMLACQPNEITLAFLRDTLRKESQQMIAEMPNKVWDNLFYQQQDKRIQINLTVNTQKYEVQFLKKENEGNVLLLLFRRVQYKIIFNNYGEQKYEMHLNIPVETKTSGLPK
ncbi:MAG: ATP-binding protein [Sphingobacteriales bacterium]|nr:ATP-binding protein [Sphingobacteriales bacterium]